MIIANERDCLCPNLSEYLPKASVAGNPINWVSKRADIIIAISKQTKKDIVKYLSIDEKKIKVVYQGCNDVFKKTISQINNLIQKIRWWLEKI